MSKRNLKDREMARKMRSEGKSYSEIKEVLKASKSTLSLWLRDMPLSVEQMRKVRDFNPKRIERYRATMNQKRENRMSLAYLRAAKDIGVISSHQLFLAGLFLYWGEGAKSMRGTLMIANTDPAIALFFLRWLHGLGVERKRVKVKLHLYNDMDTSAETSYWSKILNVPLNQFRNPYIKNSALTGLTYKNGFGHGTCNVILADIGLWEYVMASLKYLRELS